MFHAQVIEPLSLGCSTPSAPLCVHTENTARLGPFPATRIALCKSTKHSLRSESSKGTGEWGGVLLLEAGTFIERHVLLGTVEEDLVAACPLADCLEVLDQPCREAEQQGQLNKPFPLLPAPK